MHTYLAWITAADGIARPHALIAFDRDDARTEAQHLARALYGAGFTFCVRPA